MSNSIFSFERQKRNFQDDCAHYVPSLKKKRLWDEDEDVADGAARSHLDVDSAKMREPPSNTDNIDHRFEFEKQVQVQVQGHSAMAKFKYEYMPDLNAAQNPHYYEYNKLLFELYVERIRRCKPHNPVSVSCHRLL